MSPFFLDIPNITIYAPSNPLKMASMFFKAKDPNSPIEIDNFTMEFIVKLRTNLKLNLIEKNGDRLIQAYNK